jgi:hypothetical protein
MIKGEDRHRLRSATAQPQANLLPAKPSAQSRVVEQVISEGPSQSQTKPKQKKAGTDSRVKWQKKYVLIGLVTVCVIAVVTATGFVLYSHDSTTPLANSTANSVNFPLYYPSPLYKGYHYVSGSAKAQNDIVFFGLKDGSAVVYISEQAVPLNTQDIGKLSGFKSMFVPSGSAYVGSALNAPTVIIVSSKTLITLRGSSGMSIDTISQIAKEMSLIKH